MQRLSKFLSLLLRHKPETIGLKLDENGWANLDELIKLAPEFNLEIIKEIVKTCEKQRYCLDLDNNRIRANQGHSIPVNLNLQEKEPPEFLFHGTATKNLNSIFQYGIKKQNRQHVHLSENKETALKVGKRHGEPIILIIKSSEMFKKGIKFYLSENNVWLTDFVDNIYIEKEM